VELNNKRNGEIDRSSGVWYSPLRADIIAVSGREPVIQYLVIKREELGIDSLLVVVKLYGLRQYILRIATTGETKNCVGNQSGKAITEYCLRR
jgi:hypothetical protein